MSSFSWWADDTLDDFNPYQTEYSRHYQNEDELKLSEIKKAPENETIDNKDNNTQVQSTTTPAQHTNKTKEQINVEKTKKSKSKSKHSKKKTNKNNKTKTNESNKKQQTEQKKQQQEKKQTKTKTKVTPPYNISSISNTRSKKLKATETRTTKLRRLHSLKKLMKDKINNNNITEGHDNINQSNEDSSVETRPPFRVRKLRPPPPPPSIFSGSGDENPDEIKLQIQKNKRHAIETIKRPEFHAYGRGNTNPTADYNMMLSYNVQPQLYPNHPPSKQVYQSTEAKVGELLDYFSKKKTKLSTVNTGNSHQTPKKKKNKPIEPPRTPQVERAEAIIDEMQRFTSVPFRSSIQGWRGSDDKKEQNNENNGLDENENENENESVTSSESEIEDESDAENENSNESDDESENESEELNTVNESPNPSQEEQEVEKKEVETETAAEFASILSTSGGSYPSDREDSDDELEDDSDKTSISDFNPPYDEIRGKYGNDPKNYVNLPIAWLQAIEPAGVLTVHSESVASLLCDQIIDDN